MPHHHRKKHPEHQQRAPRRPKQSQRGAQSSTISKLQSSSNRRQQHWPQLAKWVERFKNVIIACNITADARMKARLHYAEKEVFDTFQSLPDSLPTLSVITSIAQGLDDSRASTSALLAHAGFLAGLRVGRSFCGDVWWDSSKPSSVQPELGLAHGSVSMRRGTQ